MDVGPLSGSAELGGCPAAPPPDRVSGDNAIHHINPESPQDHGAAAADSAASAPAKAAALAQQSIKNGHIQARAAAIGESRGEGSNQPKCASVRPGDVQIRQNVDAAGLIAESHPDAPQDDFLGGKGLSRSLRFSMAIPTATALPWEEGKGNCLFLWAHSNFSLPPPRERRRHSFFLFPSAKRICAAIWGQPNKIGGRLVFNWNMRYCSGTADTIGVSELMSG